jgi:putative flippase GtrA
MDSFRQEFASKRFLKFLVVGGLAATVNFCSRYLLSYVLAYSASIAAAYVFGMATAYTLAKLFVFEPAGHGYRKQITYFVAVNMVALVQTLIVSEALARWLLPAVGFMNGRFTLAHGIGLIIPAFTSYLGHKYFSFRSPALESNEPSSPSFARHAGESHHPGQ